MLILSTCSGKVPVGVYNETRERQLKNLQQLVWKRTVYNKEREKRYPQSYEAHPLIYYLSWIRPVLRVKR